MKKQAFFLLAVLTLAACADKTSYKITGSFTDGSVADSTMVYLQKRVVREWVMLDSAVVADGRFTIEGKTGEPFFAYLTYKVDGRRQAADLIVEPGNIDIAIAGRDIRRAGAPQNDLLQSYYDADDALYRLYEAKYEEFQSQPQTPESEAAWGAYVDSLQNVSVAQAVDFILANANTLPANVVFITNYYGMSIQQKDAIINAMDEKSRAYDRVPLIIETLEVERRTAIGQPFTDIVLPDVNGNELALSSLVGKTDFVLVDFWASWCGPCRASFPELTAFYKKYAKTGKLEILGVSLDRSEENWKEAIEKDGLAWRHVSDLQYWDSAGAQAYGVNSIPSTVLINAQGVIVGRNLSLTEVERFITGEAK